jgi:hypothetical protein
MTPSEPPVLSAPFRTDDRWMLWPRLHLHIDRLNLTEWWGRRRVWCHLPLPAIQQVECRTPTRLRVRTRAARDDCAPVTLRVDEAERWASTIRAFRACLDEPE